MVESQDDIKVSKEGEVALENDKLFLMSLMMYSLMQLTNLIWEVNCTIDLVVIAILVSRASYCLCLNQNKKISDMLIDLLNKGYIQPNKYLWCASILLR